MSDAQKQKCTHVIFDVDGLLLDTETIYTEIFSLFLNEFGKKFTMDVKVKMMGKPELVAIEQLLEELKLTDKITVQEAYNKTKELKIQLFPKAKLMPGTDPDPFTPLYGKWSDFQFLQSIEGAERLIRHLHQHRIPMALATGSGTFEFNLKTSNHQDLLALVSYHIKSDDPAVKQGKPHPDIFLVAASKFNPPPTSSSVLVFEDAPNGVQAARAAGMNVIMVPPLFVDKALCGEAHQLLNSLEEFKPSAWGLPAFS